MIHIACIVWLELSVFSLLSCGFVHVDGKRC
jgi:hypothetical protein